jgi:hypothetical protein
MKAKLSFPLENPNLYSLLYPNGFANLQLSKTLLSFSFFEKSTRTPNGNIMPIFDARKIS